MSLTCLIVSVGIALLIQHLSKIGIGLIKEIGRTDSYPIKGRLLGKLDLQLVVGIVING